MHANRTLIILTCGGTIAGVGENGQATGYWPGALTGASMVQSVPGLAKLAHIEVIEVCQVNSDDMNSTYWESLSKTILSLSVREDVAGFVVTHGTDTLEETAYYLQLTVGTDKPVVVTGAMRPSTALSADGPMNLLQAATVALHPEAAHRGVLVVFANHIFSARYVSKISTHALDAFDGGEAGFMGTVLDREVSFFYHIDKVHTSASIFRFKESPCEAAEPTGGSASRALQSPRVSCVYFALTQELSVLTHALSHSDGIVIIGAGMGEYNQAWIAALSQVSMPVIITSRTGTGPILSGSLLNSHVISAGDLSPSKAALLLRLCLMKGLSVAEISDIFSHY